MHTSKKIKTVLKNVKIMHEIFNKITPFLPKAFPNKPVHIQLITGKNSGNKYIEQAQLVEA